MQSRTKNVTKAYIPTKDELEDILATAKEQSLQRWVMCHFSYFAGLRAMEISQLSIGDVFEGNEIPRMSRTETKGGGTRRISLVNENLRSALVKFYEVQNLSAKPMTAPLFTNTMDARFTADGVVKQFIKVYKPFNENRTKVRKLSSHSGRRYFATVLGNTPGITTKQLMELGGWKSPDVAMHYVESNDEHLDKLVNNAKL